MRSEQLTKEGDAVDFDVVTELGFPDRTAYLAWRARLSGPGAGDQVGADEESLLDAAIDQFRAIGMTGWLRRAEALARTAN